MGYILFDSPGPPLRAVAGGGFSFTPATLPEGAARAGWYCRVVAGAEAGRPKKRDGGNSAKNAASRHGGSTQERKLKIEVEKRPADTRGVERRFADVPRFAATDRRARWPAVIAPGRAGSAAGPDPAASLRRNR